MKHKYVVADTRNDDDWLTIPALCVIPINVETRAIMTRALRVVEYAKDELLLTVEVSVEFPVAWLDENPSIEEYPEADSFYVLETDEPINLETEPSHLIIGGDGGYVKRYQDLPCMSCWFEQKPTKENFR